MCQRPWVVIWGDLALLQWTYLYGKINADFSIIISQISVLCYTFISTRIIVLYYEIESYLYTSIEWCCFIYCLVQLVQEQGGMLVDLSSTFLSVSYLSGHYSLILNTAYSLAAAYSFSAAACSLAAAYSFAMLLLAAADLLLRLLQEWLFKHQLVLVFCLQSVLQGPSIDITSHNILYLTFTMPMLL